MHNLFSGDYDSRSDNNNNNNKNALYSYTDTSAADSYNQLRSEFNCEVDYEFQFRDNNDIVDSQRL